MLRQTARRILLASTLVLGVSAGLAPSVLALDEDGSPQQGEVLPIEVVTYTPASKFDITADTAVSGQSFGTVNVHSNANGGWTLSVKSLTGGVLKHTVDATKTITYSLKVDGTGVGVGTANSYAQAKAVTTLTCAATGGCDYPVTADITAAATNGKPAGTYEDTITFKLVNN